jgi:hypothetical protein
MNFGDISRFDRIEDYLPILNAALIVDLVGIFGTFKGIIDSKTLKTWYKKYHIMALLADVMSIVIGLILTRFAYYHVFSTFNIFYFAELAVVIQVFHDLFFYTIFQNVPVGHNAMLDFFKIYAKEVGLKAIIADSTMIVATCLLASLLSKSLSTNANIILLIFASYLVPYFLNYE